MASVVSPVPAAPTPTPAVLIADPGTAGLRVIALTLLDRLVVAAHRAGCHPIVVVSQGPPPELTRADALGIRIQVVPTPSRLNGRTLVANTRQLVLAPDLRRLLNEGGRLVDAGGRLLPAGIIERTGPLVADPWTGLPEVKATGVAVGITDEASARAAGESLWASLNSAADGTVDRYFNRPVGRRLMSRWLVHTPVTPNPISIAATILGVTAGAMFGMGDQKISIVAAILFQISAIIDCVDGDVARAVFKESPLGKWLDLIGDQVVHASVFAGIAIGLWRPGADGTQLWLGGSAVIGGLISFAVILRGLRQPVGSDGRLQKLIDAATNRDFSVLVLGLALADRLGWFLWMAAIGSHAFWMLALALQLPRRAGTATSR